MNLLDLGIEGIKCDAEGCDYEDSFGSWGTSPEEIKAMNEKWLNTPCPKCGASLLTEEDARAVLTVVEMASVFNDMGDELKEKFPELNTDERIEVRLEMDGTGNIDIKEK